MSGPANRPWIVTILALLTALAGLATLAEAVAGLATGNDASAGSTVGGALAGLALVAIAVRLWQGSNGARLLLTAVVVVRLSQAVYDATTDSASTGSAVAAGIGAAILVALAWLPGTTAWFAAAAEQRLARAVGRERRTPRERLVRAAELAVQILVMWGAIAIAPGVEVAGPPSALLAAVLVALATWAMQPLWLRVASGFGWPGALVTALLANAITVALALWIAPGVTVDGPGWALVASWLLTLVLTVVAWLFSASSHDYLLVHATRAAMRGEVPETDGKPGMLVIQLDGVSAPLLEQELRAGNLPTIARWIRSGSHRWTEWTARVPSTTPVSQAGILHGSTEGIPAFQWWSREHGRMMAVNVPADSQAIEERLSDGAGLLADGGVSVSNLFSGDAPRAFLTVSGLRSGDRSLGPARSYAAFFAHPAGLGRAVTRTIGEAIKEVWQARRQEWRGIEPRVHRGGQYVALRAVTNVLLRDLNVALVIEAMMGGAKTIYVDFVDYDEIAHHAGVTRPEALASLYGIDATLRTFERFVELGIAPRDYRIVLVSDHGQSQGATFLQRYGMSLRDVVAAHTGGRAMSAVHDDETRGRVRLLVRDLAAQETATGRFAERAMQRSDEKATRASSPASPSESGPEIAVIGSGNLGGVWFTESATRLTLADLEREHPGLVETLATHPGVGFIVVMAGSGPVAIGANGVHRLASGEIEGEDPLAPFGPDAREDFRRVAEFAEAPDIYLNSLHDPALDEVAAFEELVGCHGGLGGWQTRPMLVYPSDWELDPELLTEGRLRGAEAVHRQLVRWLEAMGHREGVARGAGDEAAGTP